MTTLKNRIEHYSTSSREELSQVISIQALESFRIKHLSRKGLLQEIVQELASLDIELKKQIGPLVHELKDTLNKAFEQKEQAFKDAAFALEEARTKNFDVTAYKPFQPRGSLHPYTHVIEQIEDIFISMGFSVVDGPEVEKEYYNFDALNIPADHPARDMQDTFWLTLPEYLLRTHTSSVEIHAMKSSKPPLALIVPGRAYRNEATDASHDFMFMQLEGLYVDKGVSLAHLIATMKTFLQTFFEKRTLSFSYGQATFLLLNRALKLTCPVHFVLKGARSARKLGG